VKKFTPILIALLIVAIATIIIFYVIKDNSNTTMVYCGPNKTDPARIFVNPEKAFPSFATAYTVKLNSGINLLDTLNQSASIGGNADSEIQTEIVELREKLNQDNIRMENLLKVLFYAYNGRPCDADVSKRYFNLLDTLTFKITEIEKLKAAVIQPQKVTPDPIDPLPGAQTDTSNLVITSVEVVKDTSKVNNALRVFKQRIKYPTIQAKNTRIE